MEFVGYLPLTVNSSFSEIINGTDLSQYLDNYSLVGASVTSPDSGDTAIYYIDMVSCLYSPIRRQVVAIEVYIPMAFGLSFIYYLDDNDVWSTTEQTFEPVAEFTPFEPQWLNYACLHGFDAQGSAVLNDDQQIALQRILDGKTTTIMLYEKADDINYPVFKFYRVLSCVLDNDKYVLKLEWRTNIETYHYYPETHRLEYFIP